LCLNINTVVYFIFSKRKVTIYEMTQTKCDKNGESANSITETPLT